MTAKDRLRERIEALTEEEASETLRLLDLRSDPVIVAFRDAPVDDEPWSEADEAAAAEGRADVAAGRTVPLDPRSESTGERRAVACRAHPHSSARPTPPGPTGPHAR